MKYIFSDTYMDIAIIVARADNGIIGCRNALPWKIPEDLHRFRQMTKGHHVVVGRVTYEGMPPLNERTVIVLSRNHVALKDGDIQVSSLEEAIDIAKDAGETILFIAGGREVYTKALDHANIMHITEVHMNVVGDTRFPSVDFAEWKEVHRIYRHKYSFVELRKFDDASFS